jgi:SAM-dependent methyltransferase
MMHSALRPILRVLPTPFYRAAKFVRDKFVLRLKDIKDARLKQELFGDIADLVPPLHVMQDGPQDYRFFKRSGELSFQLFREAGLKPTDRVLDIGSGLGRQILPLTKFLTTGSLEGLEPIDEQVQWTQRITARFPNFKFHKIDVWSKVYNPDGSVMPADYALPFPDDEFDFVTMNSVFTHMFIGDIRHYVGEIARVLKPGGRGTISYFLLNDDSVAAIATGKSDQTLVYEIEEGSRIDNQHRMETAIGIPETAAVEMYNRHGIDARVEHGSWDGRKARLYQDMLFLARRD